MAQCPVCHAEVVDDFGLVECSNCGAQLLVHMDGRVEHSGAKVAEDSLDPMPVAEGETVPQEPAVDFAEPPQEFEMEPSFHPAPEPAPIVDEPAPEPAPEPPAEAYQLPSMTPDSPDLSDIAQFGNSDASAGRDGSLRYNIVISGIDTSDVREAFRDIIIDRKFLWDTDQVLRSIKGGQVRIENVGPAKAYMLVESLRTLPVVVEWEQYAVHQA